MQQATDDPAAPAIIQLQLPCVFNGSAVRSLLPDLLAALRTRTPVSLQGAQVDEAGTAAVQLVIAAARDFASEGLTLTVAEPSDGLCNAFEAIGLFQELMQITEVPEIEFEIDPELQAALNGSGGSDGW